MPTEHTTCILDLMYSGEQSIVQPIHLRIDFAILCDHMLQLQIVFAMSVDCVLGVCTWLRTLTCSRTVALCGGREIPGSQEE